MTLRRSVAEQGARPRRQDGLTLGVAAAGLAALVLALYAPVASHEFINLDDDHYIYRNPVVSAGLTAEGLVWAFSTCHASNWHPLTWLSHMLDCQMYGLEPGGHHLTSVVLHAISAVLLLLLLRGMTGAFAPALFVAALFAVHPLRVESVAWAAERKDVLAGLFWMLTLLAYVHYARRPAAGRYALVVAGFALGLMAKPMLVTLPCVLLLLDVWPLGRWRPAGWTATNGAAAAAAPARPPARLLLEKLPLLALAAASSAVTVVCQSSGAAMGPLEDLTRGALQTHVPPAYVAYLWKTVWPAGLAVFYPHPVLVGSAASGALAGRAVAAAGLLLAVTWLALASVRRRPYLAVGWLWYLGTLVPVIGIVQVGSQAMADRYAYIPLIGIYVMVAWGARDLVAGRSRAWRIAAGLVAVAIVVAFAAVTRNQVGHWKNDVTLFRHALAVTRDNFLAHNNLGVALRQRDDLVAAAHHHEQAVRIMPGYARGHDNLAVVLRRLGRLDEAREHFEHALRLDPGRVETRYNLGNLFLRQGDLPRAAAEFERVVALAPDYFNAHYNLGITLLLQGDLAGAEGRFRRALALDPAHADARNNLGLVLARQGRTREAEAEYREALRLVPDHADARDNLRRLLEAGPG